MHMHCCQNKHNYNYQLLMDRRSRPVQRICDATQYDAIELTTYNNILRDKHGIDPMLKVNKKRTQKL